MEHEADRHPVANHANGSTSPEGEYSALIDNNAPVECTDGSLVIDSQGRVRKATPEQQQEAMKARRTKGAKDKR